MSRREFDDDEEWEQIDSHSQEDDYHVIQSEGSKRNEKSNYSEPATPKDHAAASDESATQRESSRSNSPQEEHDQEGLHDNSMALVKRTPSDSEFTLAHRSRPSHSHEDHQCLITQSVSHRSRSPDPMQQSQRSRTPVDACSSVHAHEHQQRNSGRTGHTYGAVYATGRSTVIMGNIGAVPEGARSHTYGPVFTADDAKVYFGDATTEETAKAFQRRDERR